MMLSLNLIMPMAGQGTRVKELNLNVHKPFIILDKVPLYQHALHSLASFAQINKKFAILPPDSTATIPEFTTVVADHVTRGPLESVMALIHLIPSDIPFAILDCDLSFSPILPLPPLNSEALIFSFKSSKPIYSYVKLNNKSVALEIAEKVVISETAIAGCYIFKSRANFIKHANLVRIKNSTKSELFISDVLRSYLSHNLKIVSTPLSSHCSLGTTQDILTSGLVINKE